MKYCLTLLLLVFSQLASSQSKYNSIDWNKFEEPSGKLFYVSLSPSLNVWKKINGRFWGVAVFSSIDTFLTFSTYSNLRLQNLELSNPDLSNSNSARYRKYFNKRRGFFAEGYGLTRISRDFQSNQNYLTLGAEASVGIGRLEHVSTIYQAQRIFKTLPFLKDVIDTNSELEVLELASFLRSLDYSFLRDLRRQDIFKIKEFLGYIENKGSVLNEPLQIAQLTDAYLYGRYGRNDPEYGNIFLGFSTLSRYLNEYPINPIGSRQHGQELKLGYNRSTYLLNNSAPDFSFLFFRARKSIILKDVLRISGYISTRLFFNDQNVFNYNYGVGTYFLPTSRTGVSVNYDLSKATIKDFSEYSERISFNLQYFISFNTAINAELNWFTKESLKPDQNNFNIQLQHYFY